MSCVRLLPTLLLVTVATLATSFECPSRSGYFADPLQCDKYYRCRNGKPEERLCPDGKAFHATNPLYERCDLDFDVDCSTRPHRQPAQESPHCPRKYGIFPYEDPDQCSKFWQCDNGIASVMRCQVGLSFNPDSGKCHWSTQDGSCKGGKGLL